MSLYQQKTTKNYQNILAKDLKDECIGMNIKQKVKIKIWQKEYRYFLESNFVGVNRLFVLIYLKHNDDANRYKVQRYYAPKGIIKSHNVIVNGRNFYDQLL